MLYEKVSMSEKYSNVTLTSYVNDDAFDMSAASRRRAVIVCPGGGYHFLSEREAEPIVSRFFGAGFNVFLLRYSVAPDTKSYEPLKQAAHAIAHVRENAERYKIDPDKIYIIGFSAGGHLACSAGVLWDHPVLKREFEGKPEGINRPNGMILSYPVITAGEFAHRGSIKNLNNVDDYGEELIEEWSLERHVNKTTPPAFIWHTVTDACVPVQNAFKISEALLNNGVPFELHIFPEGPHGLSLANEETANGKPDKINPHVAAWVELAIKWAKL